MAARAPLGLMAAAAAAVLGIVLMPAVRARARSRARARAPAPAQAPAPAPTSHGVSIDQGIAYLLMLVALVLAYLIYPWMLAPLSSSKKSMEESKFPL